MSSIQLQTYVWHGSMAFFVSTIKRDCSAVLNPSPYNETLVWTWNPHTKERGEMIWQGEDAVGCAYAHFAVVQYLYDNGEPPKADE